MNKKMAEKFAPLGAVVAAAGCPVCFPALAGLGSALGLSLFARYEPQFLVLVQIFVILSMYLAYVSYKRTKNKYSLALSLISGLAMFFTWYAIYSPVVFYSGMFGLVLGAIWNFILERKLPSCKDGVCVGEMVDNKNNDDRSGNKAELICPLCSHKQEIDVPQTSCLAFYKCEKCQKEISVPKESRNCCVICEYSDQKCPVATR